jgi:hypothetical protein
VLRWILPHETFFRTGVFTCGGFAACKRFPRQNLCRSVAILCSATIFEKTTALTRYAKGYPIPLGKKSCARLVTYQQCAHQHFEKTSGPLKRKYFVNFFLSNCAAYYSCFRISIRRADSTPCHLISKAAALLCGRGS